MAEIKQDHASDPRRNTSEYSIDELSITKYSKTKWGLMAPAVRGKRPGVVDWLIVQDPENMLFDSNQFNLKSNKPRYEFYHNNSPTVFIPPTDSIEDYFKLSSRSMNRETADGSFYQKQQDFLQATAKEQDPSEIHQDQKGLFHFEDYSQSEVNPDAIDVGDDRIEDLPVFVDKNDIDCLSVNDPGKHSDLMSCDHCGGDRPWYRPLERGVRALRPGGIDEGIDSECCDPVLDDVRSCSECGCPRCNSQSTAYRKTKDPAYRCNNCGLEFSKTIDRTIEDGCPRSRLFWSCRHCGKATRAPFAGIPEDLLPE